MGVIVVAAAVTKGIMLVITQVLLMDEFIHTIRPRTMGVVLMGCGTNGRAYYEGFLSGCISGQGKDYFSCQKMTSAPTDGDGDDGGGGGGSSNGNGGGGGFGGGH